MSRSSAAHCPPIAIAALLALNFALAPHAREQGSRPTAVQPASPLTANEIRVVTMERFVPPPGAH
jgi:hypothetical protein